MSIGSYRASLVGAGALFIALVMSGALPARAQSGLAGAASSASRASTAAVQSANRQIRDSEQSRMRFVQVRPHYHQHMRRREVR